tara:strand:+ start:91 stop:846 length:756 start_codon:yes stop_codon:yes gene_type:complete
MDIINKINQSRKQLKNYLTEEWDTSVIQDYSNTEIHRIYTSKKNKNEKIDFGKASALNIVLSNRKIPQYKLYIIYYNFPDLNSRASKITKQCGQKMNSLYADEIINREDSIILIIPESITENIEKTIESLYHDGLSNLTSTNLSDEILEENEKLKDNKYRIEHFRNIHVFDIKTLSYDISQHTYVPKHRCIRGKNEIKSILKKTNSIPSQLPIIQRTDPMAKRLRLAPGDICEITRNSERCGDYLYYRICE